MPRSISHAAIGSIAWPHTCISLRTSSITDSVPATAPADERHLDAEPPEFLREQALHAAVDPLARQQMIARPQHRQMRQRDGAHPAREEDRRLRALERGEALRDRRLVGVVAVAGVEDLGG